MQKTLLLVLGVCCLLAFPVAAVAGPETGAAPETGSGKTEWSADEAYDIAVDYATNQDYDSAFEWFRQAAESGHLKAQSDLAFMYAQGLGTPQDHDMALDWYRRAAEEGLPDAQTNLGVMYLNGLGTPVDVSEAYKWVRLAAQKGQTEGVELLEVLEEELTREQIAEGTRRAEAWREKAQQPTNKTTRAE